MVLLTVGFCRISTVISRDTDERAPFWSMAQDDSPLSSSALRPKRTGSVRISQLSHPDASVTKKPKVTRDDSTSSTIVTVESDVTKAAASSVIVKKKRVMTSNNKSETTSSTKTTKRRATTTDVVSFDSPIANSDRTAEDLSQDDSVQKQRVSLSPMFCSIRNQDPLPIPAFDGSDYDNLCSCLEVLRTAHRSNTPTICFTNSAVRSKFARNLQAVSSFLQALVASRGKRGTSAKTSAALYVCGAPGLGKSSGVRWCCDMVSKSAPVGAKVCHVNAAHLTSHSNPMRFLLDEMGKSLGIKAKQPKESAILRLLRTAGNNFVDDPTTKAIVLVLVVDEIDALVTGNGKATASKDCLRTLLEWANCSTLHMGLIGISNCMNDEKRSDIHELGKVSCAKASVATYFTTTE
jgi:AAA domain